MKYLTITNSDGDTYVEVYDSVEATFDTLEDASIYGLELIDRNHDTNYWPENAYVVIPIASEKLIKANEFVKVNDLVEDHEGDKAVVTRLLEGNRMVVVFDCRTDGQEVEVSQFGWTNLSGRVRDLEKGKER